MENRRRALAALLATTGLGTAGAVWAAPAAWKAGVFEPPRQAPDFSLRGSDGRELTLARYRGKVVLLAFGFVNCAAVCPTTLATLAQARRALGAAAGDVQVLFITVDPERDDPALLKKYLANFDASFVGGSGAPEQLALVRQHYGVVANKVALGDGYAVDHSSSIFIIDRQGRLRALMPYGHDARDFVHDLQRLLQ